MASAFTREVGSDWRFVADWNFWMVWDGMRFARERTLRVLDEARRIVQEFSDKAAASARGKLETSGTVGGVVKLARADRVHAATTNIWDADPWLFNTPGGVIDLRSGKRFNHDRTFLMTKIAAAAPDDSPRSPDESSPCPRWLSFLHEVMAGDTELIDFLQRVVGYGLTGVTSEHAIFFFHGSGSNGKSVFLSVLDFLLGDYAKIAPIDLFMATAGERHPTDLAGLRGARLVTAIETEEGRRWAESKLKALTGGDRITARFMRADFFEYVPAFKLLIAGNHKPSIRNVDEAMRRRLHLIPFKVRIPPARRDKTLVEKLKEEGPGILAWAIDGCLQWQSIGLAPPQAVVAATAEYFEAEDAVGRWLDERCVKDPRSSESNAMLFASFKGWAEANGEFVISKRRLSGELSDRGFVAFRDMSSRGFRGVRLQDGSGSTEDAGF